MVVNFVVAADDSRELNNVFPGILEGYKDLGDGTIQINESIAKSAMETAKTKVQVDTEAAIQTLKLNQQELISKQIAAQRIAHVFASLSAEQVKNKELTNDPIEIGRAHV